MSYANGTTHYNLPQTVGTDKRDWFDTNQAFEDVDAAIYGAVQSASESASALTSLTTRVGTAENDIDALETTTGEHTTSISALQTAVTANANAISEVESDAQDMITAYNEASATSTHAYTIGDYFIYNDVLYKATAAIAIGDTIVPDTNCSTTNVTTEISQLSTDLAGSVGKLAGNRINYSKVGKTVIVTFTMAGDSFTANTTIATIPEGFRPSTQETMMISGSSATTVNINTDGTIVPPSEISAFSGSGAVMYTVN